MTHILRPPVGEAVDTPIVVGAFRHEQALPTVLRVRHSPVITSGTIVVVVVVVVEPGGRAGAAAGVSAAAGVAAGAGVAGVGAAAGVAAGAFCCTVVVVDVVVSLWAYDRPTADVRNSAVASTNDLVMGLLRIACGGRAATPEECASGAQSFLARR